LALGFNRGAKLPNLRKSQFAVLCDFHGLGREMRHTSRGSHDLLLVFDVASTTKYTTKSPSFDQSIVHGFLLGLFSLTSRFVGQPLAFDALQGAVAARDVANAKRNAVVVTKIKLGQIAVKMLLAAVLVDTDHAALEDVVVAFNGVGGDESPGRTIAIGIFLAGVVNFAVSREILPIWVY
jgi:hypothetical protein